MKRKLTGKLLALLLAVLMVVSLLPVTALAASYTLTYKSCDESINAEWDVWFAYASNPNVVYDLTDLDFEEDTALVVPADIYALYIWLLDYNSDDYTFLGWRINDTEYFDTVVFTQTSFLADVGESEDSPSGVYMPNEDGDYQLVLYGEILTDTIVEPVFEAKQTIAFTPTVSVAAGQEDRVSGDLTLVYNNGDESSSNWTLTTTPAAGWELSYIQLGDDQTTRVESADGKTVTWDVTADGAWTAYFDEARMHINTASFGLTFKNSDKGGDVSGTVSDGQRAGVSVKGAFPSNVSAGPALNYALYAGETASGTPLATYTYENGGGFSAGSLVTALLSVDAMPAGVTAMTVSAQLGDGTPTTKTIPVSVNASGSMNLTYLDVPGGGLGYETAGDGGPAVYDAAACVDPDSGAMTLYLGTSDGVAAGDGVTFAKLGDLTGNIVALGTDATGNLTAVQVITPELNSQNDEYRVYRYIDGGWSTAEADPHLVGGAGNLQIGLVMGSDDVWLQNARWDGNTWASTMSFNSFWKADDTTAYAGSANGIYVYSKGAETPWTHVDNTSGTTYITSGCRTAAGATLTVSDSYNIAWRLYGQANVGTVQRVNISGTTATVTAVDKTGGGNYVGLAADGTLYSIDPRARLYENQSSSAFYGSYLYKQLSDGSWQHQIVDAFNDPTMEDDDPSTKYRPDCIDYILSPCDGVTLLLGDDGAIYALYGDATISFDSHGGSDVAAITAPVSSTVTAPTSPTRDGFTFVGWYTLENLLNNGPTYTWGVMPAKDIELHAKWVEAGGGVDPLAEEREKALATLETYVDGLVQSDYSAEVWAQIQEAYNSGKSGIENAGSYDGIYAALNTAIETISGLAQTASGEITVAVSVDANTLGLGYIIEPTLVTVKKGTPASVVVTDLLSEYAAEKYGVTTDGLIEKHPGLENIASPTYPWASSGSVLGGFYLSDIYFPEQQNYTISDTLQQFIQTSDLAPVIDADKDGRYLGEFDYVSTSGWMYSIGDKTSGGASFPGVGASGWSLADGEVMRWQFTLVGYGADLGADNTQWGAEAIIDPGDKSALTWKVAEINKAGEQEKYGEAYDEAVAVLTDAESTQAEVDAALRALNAIDNPGGGDTPTPGTTPTENKMPFVDVPEDAFYYDAVLWAVNSDPQITNGTSETTFEPDADCLREQIVTFLWRAAGKPAPTVESVPFEDVEEGAYYYDAVLWAYENGITLGIDATHFGIGLPCTREQVVTFLWRAAGKPAGSGTATFSDVADGEYYTEAVNWAAGQEITLGIGDGLFGTGLTCTRGQIVTFLYRAREE